MTCLAPCPCCGGKADLQTQVHSSGMCHRVACEECLLMTDWTYAPQTAVDTWNHRVNLGCRTCAHRHLDESGSDYTCDLGGCVRHSEWVQRDDYKY